LKAFITAAIFLIFCPPAHAADAERAKKAAELARTYLSQSQATEDHAKEQTACFMLGIALVHSDFSEKLIGANDYCGRGVVGLDASSKTKAIASLDQFINAGQ
jgi:hypothetical protein